jgi:hypothetical protein
MITTWAATSGLHIYVNSKLVAVIPPAQYPQLIEALAGKLPR